jgi:hypothetical protein
MFYADRKSSGGDLTIHLFGEIDENADVFSVVGSTPMAVVFNTRGVTNINPTGVGNWLKYVQSLNGAGIKVTYSECSMAFAPCLPKVVAPRYGGKVESVFAPFRCPKCKTDFQVLIKTPDIFAIKPQLANQACTHCKGPLQFGAAADKFFSFLTN